MNRKTIMIGGTETLIIGNPAVKIISNMDLTNPQYVKANGVPLIFTGGDDPVIIELLKEKQTVINPWNPSETFEIDPQTHFKMKYGVVIYPANEQDKEIPNYGLNLSNGKFDEKAINEHLAKGRKVYEDIAAGDIATIRASYSPQKNGDAMQNPIPQFTPGMKFEAFKVEVRTYVMKLQAGTYKDLKDNREYQVGEGDIVLIDVTGENSYMKPAGRVVKELKKMKPVSGDEKSEAFYNELTGKK